MDDTNPLGIVMLCVAHGAVIDNACPATLSPEYADAKDCVIEGYLPLRHIPEDVLEAKRAELLEFNSKDGLRKLTDEERDRMNATPDTAESVQSDAVADDDGMAQPLDLIEGEGFG